MGLIQKQNPTKKLNYEVTDADLLDSIVIADFSYQIMANIGFISSGDYDGALEIEAKKNDGSYQGVQAHNSVNGITTYGNDSLNWGGNPDNVGFVFPFTFRVRVTTKASAGNCQITINYF